MKCEKKEEKDAKWCPALSTRDKETRDWSDTKTNEEQPSTSSCRYRASIS